MLSGGSMNEQTRGVNHTTSALSAWYDVGEDFADLVMQHFVGPDYDRTIPIVSDILNKYDHSRGHIEYALSTNVRGRNVATWLAKTTDIPAPPGRFLDIGCAYGGLLHAFSTQGYDVCGIEVDAKVADLGRANLRALGGRCDITVGDFLHRCSLESDGTFDLITCSDVIEHVDDPRECLAKIYRLLSPGGVAYVETVNKRSAINVGRDIHFRIFGLNLLSHHSASAAYKQITGWPEYMVSDFYHVEWYLAACRALGAEVKELPGSDEAIDFHLASEQLFCRYREWKETTSRKLDFFLRQEIEEKFFAYCEQLFAARSRAHLSSTEDDFLKQWVDPVVRFAIRKPPLS